MYKIIDHEICNIRLVESKASECIHIKEKIDYKKDI